MDWRPIETAPKDGTCIIGYRATPYPYDYVWLCRWSTAEEAAERNGGDASEFEAVWVTDDDPDSEICPTHWMPFVAPSEDTQ